VRLGFRAPSPSLKVLPFAAGIAPQRVMCYRLALAYSGSVIPEPPISFGKSFNFGNPSLMLIIFSP
jgi:hypothetical protein